MKPRYLPLVLPFLLVCAAVATADDKKPVPTAPPISKQTREDLIRAFNAELVYIRAPFPMGKKGLTVKNGEISPRAEELQSLIAMWGPAVKPGDQARITDIQIKGDHI